MARKNGGPCAKPKLIRTDLDCRAALPNSTKTRGVPPRFPTRPAAVSLFVMPNKSRTVAVRDPKTIEVLELRVGYVKKRFGKLCRQDIKRPDVLTFVRSYEAEGKLETRDRAKRTAPSDQDTRIRNST